MNKVRLQEVMAKTSVAQSVCYRNHAGETIKKKFKKKKRARKGGGGSKRGGKLGREVIRHYISDNLTVPSATGAANCFHREQRGNNVLLNESLSSRLWKTHMTFCSRIELDVLFNSNPKFLFRGFPLLQSWTRTPTFTPPHPRYLQLKMSEKTRCLS